MRIGKRMVSVLLAAALGTGLTAPMGVAAKKLSDRYETGPAQTEQTKSPYYADILAAYPAGELTAAPYEKTYDAAGFTGWGGAKPLVGEAGGTGAQGVRFDENTAFIEWTLDVEKEGYYELYASYLAIEGTGLSIVRSVTINGEQLFDELGSVAFPRYFVDAGKPVVNSLGDEVMPLQKELLRRTDYPLIDDQGKYSQPFLFHLKPGRQTIRMDYVDQPCWFLSFTLKTRQDIPAYDKVAAGYAQAGYTPVSESLKMEAEDVEHVLWKSSSSITIGGDSDPLTTPKSVKNVKLNVMGSYTWRGGNQAITWKFTAPEAGLYKISLRVKQNFNNGLSSCREIRLDDAVPFQEMKNYVFPFSREFYVETLSDEGEPYLFYLGKGEHTLTMTARLGGVTDVIHTMSRASATLSELIRTITMITGSEPDVNFDYELDDNIPELVPTLRGLVDDMSACIEDVQRDVSRKPAMVNNFELIRTQLQDMLDDPDRIPRKMSDLNNALISLGDWLNTLTEVPLLVDYFLISSPDAVIETRHSNFFEKFAATMQSFFLSFVKDYDAVGTLSETTTVTENIDVWVTRGKEWSEILKTLSDSRFTPESGVNIRLNILPTGSLNGSSTNPLLLAINAGKAPDAALSIASSQPVEYAIRNAVVDLAQFSDYPEVRARFLEALHVPLAYEGGVYALPETMNFRLLFYRKDLFERYSLSVPNTWDEVTQTLLPALYQNNMQMYMPAYFDMFLVQNGGTYYSDDGYRSALDSAAANTAFRQLTEMYNNFGIPFAANFFNRMRTGEMPVGIADFAFYLQLAYAAPELKGKWDVAAIPGVKQADGSVNRATGGLAAEACILLSQGHKQESAWKFLKWWTSAETQTAFGRQVEGQIGSTARWNTANLEAFRAMPWQHSHLKVIEENWKTAVEQKVVLGGYFTTRHITNALNRCVVSHQSPRDALEEAVEQINIELKRRQESYGVFVNE